MDTDIGNRIPMVTNYRSKVIIPILSKIRIEFGLLIPLYLYLLRVIMSHFLYNYLYKSFGTLEISYYPHRNIAATRLENPWNKC